MSAASVAFQTGFSFGIVFSLLFSALLLVRIKIDPQMMLNDHPPEIKARYGPASEKTKNSASHLSSCHS